MSSPKTSTIRLLLGLALFACVFFAPPWLTAIIAAALALRFQAWEVVAAGMLMDLLWLPTSVTFMSFDAIPFATLISVTLVVGLEPLRRQLLLGKGIL